MVSATLLTVAAAAGLVMGQAPVQNYSSALDMTIDPGTVDVGTRVGWCTGQHNTCQSLCNGDTSDNQCMVDTLEWNCTCASNSSTPGIQYYTQTVPWYICENLSNGCHSSSTTQEENDNCDKKITNLCPTIPAPSKNIAPADSSSSAGSASMTSTATKSSASATGDAQSTSTSDGLAAPTMAPLGSGAFAVAAVGAFAYLL